MLDPQGPDDRFNINQRRRFPFERIARTGILLMAGHACNAVIENDTDRIGMVVGDICKGIDTRVEEGRITHAGNDPLFLAAHLKTMAQAMADRKGAAHTDSQILSVERFRPA